ncbi:hypothetical protein ECG_00805 [Echinococcus granulosus]|nr:hypothetical protein ECG_00805 [Echinococcus granulosus]
MYEPYAPESLSRRMDEVLVMEASEKKRVFSEFLSSCDFGGSPHEDIILEKLGILSQCMSKLRGYEIKPQSLRQVSTLFKSSLANQIHISSRLKCMVQDLEALLPRLNSVCESMKRISELPQLLGEVKTADMKILSDAVESFISVPSLSANTVTSTLPEFYDPLNIEKLRLDASLLRAQVGQLEEKLSYFGSLDMDPEVAASDVINTEADLLQMQKGNDLAHGLSGWK